MNVYLVNKTVSVTATKFNGLVSEKVMNKKMNTIWLNRKSGTRLV